METLEAIKLFLCDLIKPIVTEAVAEAIPKPEPEQSLHLLTLAQAIKTYPISHSTIYRLFDRGQLSKHKLGKRTALDERELMVLYRKETLTGTTARRTSERYPS